jgi:hypothetical protein
VGEGVADRLNDPCSSPISCGGEISASSISARSRSSWAPPSGESGGSELWTIRVLDLARRLEGLTSDANLSASTWAFSVADARWIRPLSEPSRIFPPAASMARREFW